MHTKGFVGSFNSHGHINPALHHRVVLIFIAELGIGRFIADHGLQFGRFPPNHRDQFGETVGISIGNIEHAGDILEDGLGCHPVERDDLGNFVVPIAFRHVIDHFTPTLNTKIGVDVRHGLPFWIEESLK